MATTEQIEAVEAWAWLEVGGGLPHHDDHFPGQRQNMAYLYFGHLRWRFTHIEPRWYIYALWGAKVFQGYPAKGLVDLTRTEIRKKFTRKIPDQNPLSLDQVDDVIANLPPFEYPFDDARRLTKMIHQIQNDDWRLARWYKHRGIPLKATDLRAFRHDLTARQISARINEEEEHFDD